MIRVQAVVQSPMQAITSEMENWIIKRPNFRNPFEEFSNCGHDLGFILLPNHGLQVPKYDAKLFYLILLINVNVEEFNVHVFQWRDQVI